MFSDYRRIAYVLALAALPACIATPAYAVHFNRGGFVPAFANCEAADANATTSTGASACAPARLSSDCTTDPSAALELTDNARTRLKLHPKGRRRTRNNEGSLDIDMTVVVIGVARCDGTLYEGPLAMGLTARMFRDDSHCGDAGCTLPDFTFSPTIECSRGRCKGKPDANPALAVIGIPPLPSTHAWSMQILDLSLLDGSGNAFARLGVRAADAETTAGASSTSRRKPGSWWARLIESLAPARAHAYGAGGAGRAKRLEARYVRAYARCLPASTTLTTGDGLAACEPVAYSNCTDDPANAVVPVVPTEGSHRSEGRGKITVAPQGSDLNVKAQVRGLESCDSKPHDGTLSYHANVRVTLIDPGCGESPCTLVDGTSFSLPMPVDGGAVALQGRRFPMAAVSEWTGAEPLLNVEMLDALLADASDNPVLAGPAAFVRCNANGRPNRLHDDAGFCFGN